MTRQTKWDIEIRENVFNGGYCVCGSALCQIALNNAPLLAARANAKKSFFFYQVAL